MPRILVTYGTTEGHTARIAMAIADSCRAAGAAADVAVAQPGALAPDGYDAVIVAASVHIGKYQREVVEWVRRHRAALAARPTAFVSVSLGVLQKDPKVARELHAICTRFFDETGWSPAVTKLVAGALLYRQYGLFKRWTMRRIAAAAGGDTDTSRDYVYTDWPDLDAFARGFISTLAAAPPRTAAAP